MEIKKKAVIVKDEAGLPNYMTMFYMTPEDRQQNPEGAPEMFKIGHYAGNTRLAVLISQYTNVVLNDIPASLPYQKPVEGMTFDQAIEACMRKGENWHLMTNTEWVYLLEEADRLRHTIGGNTNYGKDADNPEQKAWCYDGYTVLTGTEPVEWSHDGTAEGVFGLKGNFWEWVSGLRLVRGNIEYIPHNNAAACDLRPGAAMWKAAMYEGKRLKLIADNGEVKLTTGERKDGWTGCHMSEMKLEGLEEVPEIAYKLGIVPRNWQSRKDGIWTDSELEEAVPLRGSSFNNTSYGGAAALNLYNPRSHSYNYISFRSALWLDDWELITDILERNA